MFFTQNFLGNFKYNLSSFQIRDIYFLQITSLILGWGTRSKHKVNILFVKFKSWYQRKYWLECFGSDYRIYFHLSPLTNAAIKFLITEYYPHLIVATFPKKRDCPRFTKFTQDLTSLKIYPTNLFVQLAMGPRHRVFKILRKSRHYSWRQSFQILRKSYNYSARKHFSKISINIWENLNGYEIVPLNWFLLDF